MSKITAINKLQLAQEATLGTPDTLDIQPNGIDVKFSPKVEVEQIKTKSGSTMPALYSFVKKRWGEGEFSGYLDYNRAMLWFDGMFGYDASSPHTYLSSPDWVDESPKGLTAAFGQTGAIYTASGILPYSLKISANAGEPWNFVYSWFSLDPVADGGSFEALSTDVPELVHGYETALYMDEDLDATIGTTARADVAFSFEANITADHKPVWHLGDQAPDSYRSGVWGGSLKLVLEADATAVDSIGDILDAADTGKGFTIRLQATDGTNTLKLDFCGVCVAPPNLLSDTDGIVSYELNLVPQVNDTYGGCWGAELTIA